MFLKFLPLDYNNHNYLYKMVMTNKKVVNKATEMLTNSINTFTTEISVQNMTKTKNEWPYSWQFMTLVLVLLIIIYIIYFSLHSESPCYCWRSNTLEETTPLLHQNNKKGPQK